VLAACRFCLRHFAALTPLLLWGMPRCIFSLRHSCSGDAPALPFALCCSVNGEDAARALCRYRPILITGHAE